MKDLQKKVLKLVGQKLALAGSVTADGRPNVKAMLIARREGVKTFYFASNVSSIRYRQYLANPNACLYFYRRILDRGVMLGGTMEAFTDEYHRKLIWNKKMDKVYLNGGLNDPDYCVLRFTATSGRYYYMLRSESFDV